MSALHEHTAKELLSRYGVLVPEGRLCATPEEAAEAASELGGAVWVKAQAAIGDRLAASAVRRAVGAAEAAEAATAILDRHAAQVLVEREVDSHASAYLAVEIRDDGPARFLVFAREGGAGFDPATAPVAVPLGTAPIEPYELRELLAGVGCSGAELIQLAGLAHAAITCAREWHLYTLELNPVLLTAAGPVAVDAKMETDDYAVPLVPEPSLLSDPSEHEREARARRYQRGDYRGSLRYVQLVAEGAVDDTPVVGTHSVGGGESLVVLDALAEAGVKAANYCDTSGSPSREKVAFAAELVAAQPHISGLFFSTCIANQPLSVTAGGLVDGLRAARFDRPAVIRIAGNEEEEAIAIVREWAAGIGAPVEVYGRETDEWSAAARVAALVRANGNGVSG